MVKEEPQHLKMLLKSKEGATGRPDEVLDELHIPIELTRIIRKEIFLASDLDGTS